MFLEEYLDDFYYDLVMDNYTEEYLQSLDAENFKKIYHLLESYGFYFIEDIILNYIEIFTMDYDEVNKRILIIKEMLGDNFVKMIGRNMQYLNLITGYDTEE